MSWGRRWLVGSKVCASRAIWPALITSVIVVLSGCSPSPIGDFPSLAPSSPSETASVGAWDSCLRAHGVHVPAGFDPYTNTGRKLQYPPDVNAACSAYLPPAPELPSWAQMKYLAYSRCMRAHGIPAPDPTFFAGGASVVFPKGIGPLTPGFKDADTACNAASAQITPPAGG